MVAAGGINGDLARVRRHWHGDWRRPPEILLDGSHRYADGRLHDAVAAVGGRLTHLDKMWNYAAGVHHPRPRKPQLGAHRRAGMLEDGHITAAITRARQLAATGRPVTVDINVDYSRRTAFTQGAVKTNFRRFPLSQRLRMVTRAVKRRITG